MGLLQESNEMAYARHVVGTQQIPSKLSFPPSGFLEIHTRI